MPFDGQCSHARDTVPGNIFSLSPMPNEKMNLIVSTRLQGHSLLNLLPSKSFSASLIPDIIIPETTPSTAIVLIEGIDDIQAYVEKINACQKKFLSSCCIVVTDDVDIFDDINEITPLGPMRLYHVNDLFEAGKCIQSIREIYLKNKRALQKMYFDKMKLESESVSTARSLMTSALQAMNIKKDDCLLILESSPSIASIMTRTLDEFKSNCPADLDSLEKCVSLFDTK